MLRIVERTWKKDEGDWDTVSWEGEVVVRKLEEIDAENDNRINSRARRYVNWIL